MSAATIPLRITVEEFLLRPERTDGYTEELVEGIVYVSPNAKPIHTNAAARVFKALLALEAQGFVVLGETACRLSEESLPNTDVCVFRKEDWTAAFESNQYPTHSPALVVEVHSPANRGHLNKKAGLYLEGGAEQVWIIYPQTRRIRVLSQEDEGDREVREGETVLFHGLAIFVSDLFLVA